MTTTLVAADEPYHRMTTTQVPAWIASCSCGYMGLARATPAEAMEQASHEHDKQMKAEGAKAL